MRRSVDPEAGSCGALFWTFFKIGLFTFGGGYAMIALIEDEVCRKRGWISEDELSEVVAVAESTPGPIAINCATYVGHKQAGARGSAWATLGVVTPSFAIIYIISLFLEQFMRLTLVANAFKGIQVAVAFLVLRAGIRLMFRLPNNVSAAVACGLAALVILGVNLLGWRFSTVWLIALGAISGILLIQGGRRQ